MFIVFLDDEGSRGDHGTRNAQVRHRGFLKIGRKHRPENVLHDRGYTKNRIKLPKVIAFDWRRKCFPIYARGKGLAMLQERDA